VTNTADQAAMSGNGRSASLSCSDPGPEVSKRAVTQAAYRARQKVRLHCLRAELDFAVCPVALLAAGVHGVSRGICAPA